jgi:hypothetical protein
VGLLVVPALPAPASAAVTLTGLERGLSLPGLSA